MSTEVTYEENECAVTSKLCLWGMGEWMERSTLRETALRTSSAASKGSLGTVGKLEWGSRRSGVVEGLGL
jgi:hypothetical protein